MMDLLPGVPDGLTLAGHLYVRVCGQVSVWA